MTHLINYDLPQFPSPNRMLLELRAIGPLCSARGLAGTDAGPGREFPTFWTHCKTIDANFLVQSSVASVDPTASAGSAPVNRSSFASKFSSA